MRYESLHPVDGSSQVLPMHLANVAVVRLPQVGWTALGPSPRVDRVLSAQRAAARD